MRIKRKINNKLKGAFGQTTYNEDGSATVEVNKKRHKDPRALKTFPKADRPLINTMVHEELHAQHPKMHERTVRKVARRRVARMGRKAKNRMYQRYA